MLEERPCSSRLGHDETAGRIGFVLGQAWIVDKQRRAVGAQDLAVAAHVEEDVRMVKGRPGPHAHEFLNANEYALGAFVIGEMGYGVGHGGLPVVIDKPIIATPGVE